MDSRMISRGKKPTPVSMQPEVATVNRNNYTPRGEAHATHPHNDSGDNPGPVRPPTERRLHAGKRQMRSTTTKHRRTMRAATIPILFSLLLLGIPMAASASAPPSGDEPAGLHARLRNMLTQVKGASWHQSVWLTNGKESEELEADCLWAGPDRVRLDVREGRGAGFRIELESDKVTVYKPGVFSFARFKYHVGDDEVRSLRGGDLRDTGFLDDLRHAVENWDAVEIDAGFAGLVSLRFPGRDGLTTRLELDEQNLTVRALEFVDGDTVVEKHRYADVRYLDDRPL